MKKEPSLPIGGEISPSCSPPSGRHSELVVRRKREWVGSEEKTKSRMKVGVNTEVWNLVMFESEEAQ
jgi:hypothetical protein